MNVFKYLLVISITVLLTLGCVYGFSRVARGDETEETLSVTVLSDDSAVEDIPDEDEVVEAEQWVRITFDVVVIALTVGVIILVWWLIKRVTKKYGNSNRRFG